MRKPKILVMADGNFLAHVSRVLEIGKVLRDTYGYDLVYAGSGTFIKLAREAGFHTDALFTVPAETTLTLAKRAGLVSYGWWADIVNRSIDSDLAAIDRQEPDLVIADMRWTAGISARYLGIPYVSVTNAAWTNFYTPRLRAIDDHFLTRLFGYRGADFVLPFFKYLGLTYWSLPFRAWQKRNGGGSDLIKNLFDIIEGDLTLLADCPSYFPTANLPETYHYVGPILWEPVMPTPEWVLELDPDRPTIYVTMGSTGNAKFFCSAMEAFGDTDFQVVMTTGNLKVALPTPPRNFYIVKFAPGLPILQRSAVTINHAGNGSVYQALTAGVPVIAIPTHVDQALNAQRVEALGVGVKLREKNLQPGDLRQAVDRIVSQPSYRANAEKIAREIETMTGPPGAAELINTFARKHCRLLVATPQQSSQAR
jgi:MGT family glycosyltransferase